MSNKINNRQGESLAIFGGQPLFNSPKPTSNLVRPDPLLFFDYLRGKMTRSDGNLVEMLELRLASMHDTKNCVAVNSGFWGLALLLDALSLPSRKEIILPSLTYRRMADIVSWVGRVPHFCDIDLKTLANSGDTVRRCINDNTALIIGVHPVGGHCDVDGLESVAYEYGIPVIFDSVESVHEMHRGKRIGSFGVAELFSLGASKLINGFEGGYVTTNDDALAHQLRLKRSGRGAGLSLSVELPPFHAAMALAGLDDLPNQILRNRARFNRYAEELRGLPGLRLVRHSEETEPSHKNIVVEVLDDWQYTRDETIVLLNAQNILARAYYSPPLTHKPIGYEFIAADLPHTDWVADRYISMPCGHLVTLDDISKIVRFLSYLSSNHKSIRANLN